MVAALPAPRAGGASDVILRIPITRTRDVPKGWLLMGSLFGYRLGCRPARTQSARGCAIILGHTPSCAVPGGVGCSHTPSAAAPSSPGPRRNNAGSSRPGTACAQPAKDGHARAPAGLPPRFWGQEKVRCPRRGAPNEHTLCTDIPGPRQRAKVRYVPHRRGLADRRVRGCPSYPDSGPSNRTRARHRGLQPR